MEKDGTKLILMGEVDVYLSPDPYNNNKSFLKNINETGEFEIGSNMLSYIIGQLRDSTHLISKIYGFEQEKDITLSMLNLKILFFLILKLN